VKEKAVQVRTAMSQIVKREKEDPELPVQHEADGNCRSKHYDLRDTPARIDRVLSLNFGIDGFWIFPKIAEKNVAPRVFRLAILPMSIDRNPVMCMSMFIRAITISHVMPVMHMFIKGLRDSQRHRFHDAEQPI
jgi:hypothetical protein